MKGQHIIGYGSFYDFASSVFGLKYAIVPLVMSIIAGITGFIAKYIWDDAGAVYTLFFLIGMDGLIGISLSLRAWWHLKVKKDLGKEEIEELEKRKFSSSRAPRIFVSGFLAACMLAVAWNLSKANIIFYFLPGFVYGGLAGTYPVSLWENLAEFGIPFFRDSLGFIKDKLNLEKIFKKSEEKE